MTAAEAALGDTLPYQDQHVLLLNSASAMPCQNTAGNTQDPVSHRLTLGTRVTTMSTTNDPAT